MKIKYIVALLLITLLPVFAMAAGERTFDDDCSDFAYQDLYKSYYNKEDLSPNLKNILNRDGEEEVIDKIFEYCNRRKCDLATFGNRLEVFGDYCPTQNIIAFSLYINNKKLFEDLIEEYPQFAYLIDDAVTASNPNYANSYYYTPALRAVEDGQLGVLQYLVEEKKVNLFKKGGYFYIRLNIPPEKQELLTAKEIAAKAVEKWKKAGNQKRLLCAEKTQAYVLEWLRNHEYMEAKAASYNEKIRKLALEHLAEVEPMPLEIMPLFTPSLYQLQYIGGEDFAINSIEKQINGLIEQIMQNLEREFNSSELNQA